MEDLKNHRFDFGAPFTTGSFYDPVSKTSYYFTLDASTKQINDFVKDIEQCIVHETLHYVIHKLEGRRPSINFDRMTEHVLKKMPEIYYELY